MGGKSGIAPSAALTTSAMGVCHSLGQFWLRGDAKKGWTQVSDDFVVLDEGTIKGGVPELDHLQKLYLKTSTRKNGLDNISVGCVSFSGPIWVER